MTFIQKDIDLSSTRVILRAKIRIYIKAHKTVTSKVFNRRKVYLNKFLDINRNRRETLHRLQSFFSAVELLKHSTELITSSKFNSSFELRGITKTQSVVVAHVREENYQGKNRRLFLISCYWK